MPSTAWETELSARTRPPRCGLRYLHSVSSSGLGNNWSWFGLATPDALKDGRCPVISLCQRSTNGTTRKVVALDWRSFGAWIQVQISALPALKNASHFSVFQWLLYTVRVIIATILRGVVRIRGERCLECRHCGNRERRSVIYLHNVYNIIS